MNNEETKRLIGEAGYVTDEQLKKFEEESGVPKEKIDEAQKMQEVETEKFKQHVFEYQRYSDLSQIVRHLLGALKQLNKYKDKKRVSYWADVCRHWQSQTYKVLENKDL